MSEQPPVERLSEVLTLTAAKADAWDAAIEAAREQVNRCCACNIHVTNPYRASDGGGR